MDWTRFYAGLKLTTGAAERRGATATRMVVAAPAAAEQVAAAERELGRRIPEELRRACLEFSAAVEAFWFLPEGSRPPIAGLTSGVCAWSLDGVVRLERDRRAWLSATGPNAPSLLAESLAFVAVGNGDVLALHSRAGREAVVYLSGTGGPFHGWLLGDGFYDYLARTSRLQFVGPECWQLEPFLVGCHHGLVTDSPNARAWQAWFTE